MTALHFETIGEHEKASHYFSKYMRMAGEAPDPDLGLEFVANLRKTDRMLEADRVADVGIRRCDALIVQGVEPGATSAYRQRVRLLLETRQLARADLTLDEISRRDAPSNAYERFEYLPASRARLEAMRNRIGGRDLLLFLHGPSFLNFVPHLDALRDADIATATLGQFPAVEQCISSSLKRHLDIVFISHPDIVDWCGEDLIALLRGDNPPFVVSSHYVASRSRSEFRQQIERLGMESLFIFPVGGPPMPSEPLHFANGNSLACFLPLLVLGKPRRIFLIGADGGAHPDSDKTYFFDSTNAPFDFSLETVERYADEATACDRVCEASFPYIEQLFRCPTPPIYNVCLHSTHQAFPKISAAEAMRMLQVDQAIRPSSNVDVR